MTGPCIWTKDVDATNDDTYITNCGTWFDLTEYGLTDYNYCPSCGAQIEITDNEKDFDDDEDVSSPLDDNEEE